MPQGFFQWVAFLIREYGQLFLAGAGVTMVIALSGTILGFVLGLLVAIARTVEPGRKESGVKKWSLKIFQWFLSAYIEVFRGTPMMVQAMVIYYGLIQGVFVQQFHIVVPGMAAAIFIVTINTGAYMAEIVRGGIISVDAGQTEAARSIGLTHWQTMVSVVLPQAIRNIMPSIGNEFVVNIKDSSVLNVISIAELYFQSKSAAGTYLRYFEVFFITACIYFVLTFTTTRILRFLERKMDGPETYVIHGSQSDSHAAIPVRKEAK